MHKECQSAVKALSWYFLAGSEHPEKFCDEFSWEDNCHFVMTGTDASL